MRTLAVIFAGAIDVISLLRLFLLFRKYKFKNGMEVFWNFSFIQVRHDV